ncbi:nickel transporter [Desulfotomaculum copahuensis]|uniref:Nickel transporter n=2 Tax=Desulfotomaculum copahuensis TaxID=1838280 RepID=A0A1B7LBI6_9FIRM|nr:nickel transporter [Desulfotomaculum copahuensis]
MHALEPGHGKGIMGAYLVLSRGRARDAVLLGLAAALTHTLVVVALAMGARSAAWLAAAAAGAPRQQFAVWLQLCSGALVAIIGLRLLLSRNPSCCSGNCHHGDHHAVLHRPGRGMAGRPGLFPGRGAILDEHSRDLAGLLLVGVSNGLVPCPGALAVLLLSVGSGTPVAGLLLVAAFGIGGAVALVGVGLAFVRLSSLAGRLLGPNSWRWLTAASGTLITVIGILTAWQALKHLA